MLPNIESIIFILIKNIFTKLYIFFIHFLNLLSINLSNSSLKTFLSNFKACFLISSESKAIFSNFSIASFNELTVCSSKNIQVFHSTTVSKAHHLLYAITGVQEAIDSIGTSQKSSSGGNKNAFACQNNLFTSSLEILNFHSILSLLFFFNSLYNLLSVFVTKTIFFQFSLKVSTIKSNFLYGIHLQTYRYKSSFLVCNLNLSVSTHG